MAYSPTITEHTYLPHGVLVPLVTPFTADDTVDLLGLERIAHEVIDAGAEGVVALATTGEAHSLTSEERATVLEVCGAVCAAREVPLVAGVGTNDTRTALERHSQLGDLPAVRASLAVVPYYVRPSESAIVAHFEAIAAASPVPLILYNIPYRTGRGLGSEALLELAAHDRIVGLKQAVGGIDLDTLALLAAAPPRFSVLGGDDPFLLPLTLMGGSGAIAASANVRTERFVEMIDHGLAGRVREAREISEALLPLVRALFAEPSPAVVKAVLHAEGRIATPDVRMPLAGASKTALEQALRALEGVGGERLLKQV